MTSETLLTIQEINTGSVAERTDLQFADIIKTYNGVATPTNDALTNARREAEESGLKEVPVQIYRPRTGADLVLTLPVGPLGIHCDEKPSDGNSARGRGGVAPAVMNGGAYGGSSFMAFFAFLVGLMLLVSAALPLLGGLMGGASTGSIAAAAVLGSVVAATLSLIALSLILIILALALRMLVEIASRSRDVVSLLEHQVRRTVD